MDVITYALLKNKIMESAAYDDSEIRQKLLKVIEDVNVINGNGEGSISKTVADEITKIIDGAPENLNTLKELSDWINTHSESAADMNSRILQNTNDITAKFDKNQGSINSGKVAGIDESGEVVPMLMPGVTYNEETQCLEYNVDEKINLNAGIQLDETLSKSGYAADAAKVGKLKGDLVNYGDYLERSAVSELQENLLNGVTIYKGKNIDGSGREPSAGDPHFCYTDYIVASPRQMYYFVGRGYIFYEFYDINKKYVRGSYRDMGANIDTLSAISPDEARFLRLSFDTRYAKRPQVINNKIRNLVETVEKLNTEKMLDFYSFNFTKEDLLDTFSLNINNGYCEYDVSYYCTPFMQIPINAIKVSVTGYNLGDNGLYKQIVFYDKDYNYISGTFDKDEVSVPKNAIYVSCSFGKRYFENVKIIAKKENKENIENSYNKKEIDSKIDSVTLKVTNSETEMSLIDSKISSVEDKLDVERKRIDNFTSLPSGSTSGDAELQDIRVGVDGVIYPNAGEAVRKQIQATQNQISEPIKTMYRYLMVSFGYDAERLSLLGSDDLETFYLINKNAYNMTKGRTNRFRDPAITQIGKYYYIVYSDGFTDSTKLYMCRTVNFVDYEELEPIDITNADGSESIVIWAPCWFRHDGKLYVILNSDSGLRGTWYGEYDYITHTVSPTSKFNFKDYPQTIDVHIYYENNYFYAIVKDESKYYDSLHILKSDSLSGEFVSVGNNLQAFGYAEGQFAIRLDNGKIRIFAVELGLENIPIKYADLDTFESEPSEIKAIKYVGIDESYKLSHATYWDFNKFGSGYGLLG